MVCCVLLIWEDENIRISQCHRRWTLIDAAFLSIHITLTDEWALNKQCCNKPIVLSCWFFHQNEKWIACNERSGELLGLTGTGVLVLCSDEITIPGWNTIVLIDGIDDRRMSNFVVQLPARLPALLSSVFVRVWRMAVMSNLARVWPSVQVCDRLIWRRKVLQSSCRQDGFLRFSPPSALYLGRRFGQEEEFC